MSDEAVAFRIKRYGEIKSGVWAWSEWMLFQDKRLAGPWKNPEHIIIEPLYTRRERNQIFARKTARRTR